MGNILLYDFPILDRLKHDYKMCLFSNTYLQGPKNKKWIFWPWRSRMYNQMKRELRKPYNDREVSCGFMGTPTNPTRNSIASTWKSICGVFRFNHERINHTEYLNNCSNFKFGLCLTGVGPKCLRDIEYIGMGTVPIFTKEVTDEYFNPLIKDVHYIRGDSVAETKEIIESMSKETWEQMSNACIEWFEENCSIEGSFNTTMEIIS